MTWERRTKCCECGKETVGPLKWVGEYWYLGDYYGISGCFCSSCYDLVSHDPYGVPNNPGEYERLKEKHGTNRLRRALC